MKPTRQLIDALRRAADRIEDPRGPYSWSDVVYCNCGILAQELLGVDAIRLTQLLVMGHESHGPWLHRGDRAAACRATGVPMSQVSSALVEGGIDPYEFGVIELADIPHKECKYNENFANRNYVARWMRQQADILEEQLKPAVPAPVVQPGWPKITFPASPVKSASEPSLIETEG